MLLEVHRYFIWQHSDHTSCACLLPRLSSGRRFPSALPFFSVSPASCSLLKTSFAQNPLVFGWWGSE